ncbi:hypothetical protein FJ657_00125 [Schumannella soli]|uniref:Rhodanese domain-containing protein n=2 Tax=Schumannella soli TaxID=2590779 RepID=A0A506Y792_9MICO|nr:hypothetical protein FJ657_00125 [Schumannella soli]
MSSSLTSAKTTSYPLSCRNWATKPRPMLPAPKCTADLLTPPSCRARACVRPADAAGRRLGPHSPPSAPSSAAATRGRRFRWSLTDAMHGRRCQDRGMESERSVRERLASASVTVVGAGAIGSRVATTLAASGVGTIEIVDDARDGETWRAETVAGAVAATVATTHPQTIVRARPTRLAAGSTFDLLLDADLVVDASDDPATRYASNDGAAVVSIPLVWATADADGGEIGSGWDELELDYRDAHPERHPVADGAEHDATDRATDDTAASAPARQGEPSLALVTATAALASELALTLLRDRRTAGLLVRLDRTGTVGERMPLTRSPGVRPGSLEETTAPVEHPDDLGVSAIELAQLLAPESLGLLEERPVLLDVREPAEAEIARIPGSLLIPFDQLTLRMGELDATKPLVVYCHHGIRSDEALTILRRQGFAARHLTGGIESWSLTVDPAVPRY